MKNVYIFLYYYSFETMLSLIAKKVAHQIRCDALYFLPQKFWSVFFPLSEYIFILLQIQMSIVILFWDWSEQSDSWLRFAYSIMIPCKIWAFTFPLHTVAMMLIRFETIGDTNFWCDVDYWLFLGLSVFEEYNAQVFLSTYYVVGDACKQKMLSNVQ